MEDLEDPSAVFREESRFWIQRVVVPILVCIGAAGNIVSIVVLTRRRMRSSTNAYLTALAVADVIYLLFALLLSFKHYPHIHDRKFALYWRIVGISHWLCDAASSTSVWLTVSFTVERYIVVCHPMKGKVLCTEGRAKSIIAIVSVLCLLLTASTPFERQLVFSENCIRICDKTDEQLYLKTVLRNNEKLPENQTLSFELDVPPSPEDVLEKNCTTIVKYPSTGDEEATDPLDQEIFDEFMNTTMKLYYSMVRIAMLNMTCCLKNYTITTEATNLAKNRTYVATFYWFSAIFFGVLPLALIATFNCFLVNAVYKSHKKRNLMTNSQEKKSQTQENRITLLLIAVVVLFLICQIPTSSLLIYNALVDVTDTYTENIIKGLGNIFNSLIMLSASCNFILYCVLSDKYRRTFSTLCFSRFLKRQNSGSLIGSRHSVRLSTRNIIKRGKSDYARTPRNLETQSLNSIPRSKSLLQRPLGKAKTSDLIV